MTESEINTLIESKLEPLRAEIRVLQEKLGLSTPEPVVSEIPVVSSAPEISDSLEPMLQVPPERADFQKFLQRGLEQEQREYTEENLEAKPAAAKKGWNPFKR
jgi:hypothetical protein